VKSSSRPEPAERLVYASVVEGLLRHGLRGQVTPRLTARLRQIGLDVERPLLPAYPVPLWFHCMWAIVEEVYPQLPPEQAFRLLAIRHAEGYGSTVVGRALYVVARMLGPRRMAQRLPDMLASGDNYTRAEVVERGPGDYEMQMNSEVHAPGYAESLIEALLRLSGAHEPQVQVLSQGGGHTRYALRWQQGRAP
jgi:uncharacterized protein (TIGR02265 family)